MLIMWRKKRTKIEQEDRGNHRQQSLLKRKEFKTQLYSKAILNVLQREVVPKAKSRAVVKSFIKITLATI